MTTAAATDVQALQERIADLEAELRSERRRSENLRAWLDKVPSLEDPYDFRRWLASLPPDKPVRMRKREDIFETYLRARGAGDGALLLTPGEGWQTYRACGIVEEVPGIFFYAYDQFEHGWTGAQAVAWWDAWVKEYEEDHR